MEHVFAPDESTGFPGAFLRAGCGGVISTLWAVHDVAPLLLWSRFYRKLRVLGVPEVEIAEAQRWFRNLTVKIEVDPESSSRALKNFCGEESRS